MPVVLMEFDHSRFGTNLACLQWLRTSEWRDYEQRKDLKLRQVTSSIFMSKEKRKVYQWKNDLWQYTDLRVTRIDGHVVIVESNGPATYTVADLPAFSSNFIAQEQKLNKIREEKDQSQERRRLKLIEARKKRAKKLKKEKRKEQEKSKSIVEDETEAAEKKAKAKEESKKRKREDKQTALTSYYKSDKKPKLSKSELNQLAQIAKIEKKMEAKKLKILDKAALDPHFKDTASSSSDTDSDTSVSSDSDKEDSDSGRAHPVPEPSRVKSLIVNGNGDITVPVPAALDSALLAGQLAAKTVQ